MLSARMEDQQVTVLLPYRQLVIAGDLPISDQ